MVGQQVYMGESAIEHLNSLLLITAKPKIFLVRGEKSYEASGAKYSLEKIFTQLKCQIYEFTGFQENPKYEDMLQGIKLFNKSKADLILAVGGGSTIDMAKLIRFFYSYQSSPTNKKFEKTHNLLPLYTIPTTAGTGCEATQFAVMYKDGIKYSVEHADMLPNVAIINFTFTYNNDAYLTACTGFDALAQSIEAYWNINSTEESNYYAEKALSLVWANLPLAVNNPTHYVRNALSEGAFLAGKAISITRTTAAHAFSYTFTSHLGYPHGHAVALLFPYFFSLNCLDEQDNATFLQDNISIDKYKLKIQKLLSLLGLKSGKLKEDMQKYINNLGLIPKNQLKNINSLLLEVNIERLSNNPVVIGDKQTQNLVSYLHSL